VAGAQFVSSTFLLQLHSTLKKGGRLALVLFSQKVGLYILGRRWWRFLSCGGWWRAPPNHIITCFHKTRAFSIHTLLR